VKGSPAGDIVCSSTVHSFFCGPEAGSAGTLAGLNYYVLACEAREVGRLILVFGISSEAACWHRPRRTELNLIP
jgi:hypothetical protein